MGEKLISINRFADDSGLSPRDIGEAIRAGTLPAQRVGGRWVIHQLDADAYLDDIGEFDDDDEDEDEESYGDESD